MAGAWMIFKDLVGCTPSFSGDQGPSSTVGEARARKQVHCVEAWSVMPRELPGTS